MTENDLDYQAQLMADQYNFLKMVAGHLLPSKRKHSMRLDGNGDGIDAQKSVDALEIEVSSLPLRLWLLTLSCSNKNLDFFNPTACVVEEPNRQCFLEQRGEPLRGGPRGGRYEKRDEGFAEC